MVSNSMKRLLLSLLIALPAWAVCPMGTATVTGTLVNAANTAYTGSFRITWATFDRSGGGTIQGGWMPVSLSSGAFSVCLWPTTASYRIDFDNLKSATLASENWVVPTATTYTQTQVRTFTPVQPSSIITNLPSLAIVGTITTGVWHGTPIANQYGGTGDDTSATTGIPYIVSGNWQYNTDVSNTELGYLDGTTGPIQTQFTGKVGGASNLTTAGAVPYVSASGTLNQDASDFFWDVTNNRLGIGTNSFPDVETKLNILGATDVFMQLAAATGNRAAGYTVRSGGGGGSGDHATFNFAHTSTTEWVLAGVWNGVSDFGLIDAEDSFKFRWKIFDTTGNNAIGDSVTADGGYKFDIQSNGSNGSMRIYDQVTGESSLHIRAGPSQVGAGSAPFEIRRNNNTQLAGVDNAGAFFSSNGTARMTLAGVTGFSAAANKTFSWSNTSDDVDTTRDTCLGRNSSGIALVSDCSGNPAKIRLDGGITSATSAYDASLSNSTCAMPILTTNTNLQLRCKGSDGTVRKFDVTLAP